MTLAKGPASVSELAEKFGSDPNGVGDCHIKKMKHFSSADSVAK